MSIPWRRCGKCDSSILKVGTDWRRTHNTDFFTPDPVELRSAHNRHNTAGWSAMKSEDATDNANLENFYFEIRHDGW